MATYLNTPRSAPGRLSTTKARMCSPIWRKLPVHMVVAKDVPSSESKLATCTEQMNATITFTGSGGKEAGI